MSIHVYEEYIALKKSESRFLPNKLDNQDVKYKIIIQTDLTNWLNLINEDLIDFVQNRLPLLSALSGLHVHVY